MGEDGGNTAGKEEEPKVLRGEGWETLEVKVAGTKREFLESGGFNGKVDTAVAVAGGEVRELGGTDGWDSWPWGLLEVEEGK